MLSQAGGNIESGFILKVCAIRVNRIILYQAKCANCKEKYFVDFSELKTNKCFVCENCDPFTPNNAEKVYGTKGAFKIIDSKNIVFSYKYNRKSTKNYKKVLPKYQLT
jgi:hypothetical protein